MWKTKKENNNMKAKKYMLEQNKTISIYIYTQTQVFATNIYEHNKRTNESKLLSDDRYIVEHVYEIVLPIWEKYQNTHNVEIFIDRQQYGLIDLEQSYFDYMGESKNA